MYLIRRFLVALSLITCFLQADGADKYTDENRPYEFGFNIEGEQHRHEKKDENGLIMGEFGFITADGVYHVTVYATDENGKFRILSMKNIRVKPYPSGPERKMAKSLQLPVAPAQQTSVVQQTPPTRAPPPSTAAPSNLRSCSSCKIPVPTTTTQQLLAPVAPVAPRGQFPNYNTGSQQPSYPQTPIQQANYPHAPNQNTASPNYPQPSQTIALPNNPGQPSVQPNYQQPQNPNYPENTPGVQNRLGFAQENEDPSGQSNYPPAQAPQSPASRNPKQYQPNPNQPITKPMLTYAQMQIVDKNTDIYSRKPGEKEGLPPGVSKDTVSTLLYTFNYTVGFHGHHEEGYTSGAKKGYYYVTGRNGIRTRVDYEADENGFRPKITQEVLDLVSEEVPKPDTEKDEKYGLKGYEFKWLYFPDSKSR